MRRGVAVVCGAAALVVPSGSAAATPAQTITAHLRGISHLFENWTQLSDVRPAKSPRCASGRHAGQLAMKLVEYDSRSTASNGANIAVAISVYRNAASARRAIDEVASPAWRRCVSNLYVQRYATIFNETVRVKTSTGLPSWLSLPSSRHPSAVHYLITPSAGGAGHTSSSYEMLAAHDPRIVYDFDLIEADIPRAFLRSLLGYQG